ncbi:hypothetical protein NRY68_15045 [Acidithiobacillus ferrooxidans]|jgi:hypothetical protein|uniref:hypothetical protein n=1 Tax=Acidithiobacillus ferrooxidans TaxID=920 RepID=UPI0021484288|nr:hypothetical protein [Acidithiobacillus ferrooxidans]MCR1347075.1 hypothetical protein [Acidithiobacillus ferrooxidans]MCR1355861.1 hypothetical protein [Acidithiobacillus ferrooxidans]MDA8376725.1 hypothetical protein [Planctomycetia bacterium]
MSIPYMIGQRTTAKAPVSDQHGRRLQDCHQHGRNVSNLRAEDSGRTVLAPLGWSIATFGAGAILGWVATRKSSAPEPEDAAS